MRDLRYVSTDTIRMWCTQLREQLNTAAISISYAGGGSATFSPRQARELLLEYNAELDRRENPGADERGVIRSYGIEPEVYW